MLQRFSVAARFCLCVILTAIASLSTGGCSDSSSTPAPVPTPASQPVTTNDASQLTIDTVHGSPPDVASLPAVISLSPAVTDLLLAMDAGRQLVGVSSFESDSRVAHLPRVGDYETIDWERIFSLRPAVMIVQMAANRVPAGLRERADKAGTKLVVVQIDRWADIPNVAVVVGEAIGQGDAGRKLEHSLRDAMVAITARIEAETPVRTLIVVSDDGLGAAGKDTYLHDLLRAAGGANVVEAAGYVKLDRESLLSLQPDAIVQLVPRPTAATREEIRRTWEALPSLPAVKNDRVLVVDDDWALIPGSHAVELARRISTTLHPPTAGTLPDEAK